jgi:hypothetical protein
MAQAHVITLGLEAPLNHAIRLWFRQFNHLPPTSLTAGAVDAAPRGPASFERLLALMAASPHKNFILIIHGYEDGAGLHLPLTGRTYARTVHPYLQRLMDLDRPGEALTAADRRILGIGRRDLGRILDLMHQVRAKKIDCVEFRACNLGRNKLSLDRFRQFFGARVLGAPDLHSFFGNGPVVTGQRGLDTHHQGHRGGAWDTYKFPYAHSAPHLVCCFRVDRHNKPSGGHVVADTPDTLDAWVKKYLMSTAGRPTGDMALHGLWNTTRQVFLEPEDESSPLGGWGGPTHRRLILPLTENYRKHIVYSR